MNSSSRRLLAGLSAFLLITTINGAFEGYQVLSVTPNNIEDVRSLYDLAITLGEVDLWQQPAPNRASSVMIPPGLMSRVTKFLIDKNIKWEPLIDDLSRIVAESMVKTPNVQRTSFYKDAYHTDYHRYDEIREYLRGLSMQYENITELFSLDYTTHEGREVDCIRLSGNLSDNSKPAILIEAGIHAREWISPAATLFSIEQLLLGYESNTTKSPLDKYDIYIVPVTNPDGYEFTHAAIENRLWRKNRRKILRNCFGVDLNRNFNFHHGTTGTSMNCSTLIYPGTHGFSEPETANIKQLHKHLKNRLRSYVSVHSYSQYILVPWSHYEGVARPENYVELDRVATAMTNSIRELYGNDYAIGTAFQLLEYAASGSSSDWAMEEKPGIYSYTYELRPTSTDPRGFILPPKEIVPTGQELMVSLLVMMDEMDTS